MQGQIIKALAGFYYVESDGKAYQTPVSYTHLTLPTILLV